MRSNRFLGRVRSVFVVALSVVCLLTTGCGEKTPHLDTTSVTSPLGRPGVCEHCDKEIENVTEENLTTVRGNQYTVCDEKCVTGLKAWLAKQ